MWPDQKPAPPGYHYKYGCPAKGAACYCTGACKRGYLVPIPIIWERVEIPSKMLKQGWECPRCGAVNAPWVARCRCSVKESKS